jgi:hypothetical protein
MTSEPSSPQQISSVSSWWWKAALLLVFLAIGVSTIWLQKQLRQTQDDRGKAAVFSGSSYISRGASNLSSGNQSSFDLLFSTGGGQISQVDLAFDVLIDTAASPSTNSASLALNVTNTGLKFTSASVTPLAAASGSTKTGWRVNATIEPDPADSFSYADPVSLVRFNFTAPATGPALVVFDQTGSHAYRPPVTDSNGVTTQEDVLTFPPDMLFDIAQTACTYTYTDWSDCTNGQQTRSFSVTPSSCVFPDSSQLTRSCLPQCHYTYTEWTACVNGWQTRGYSTQPTNCTWYDSETLQSTSQRCGDLGDYQVFSAYTYETCWANSSEGNTGYLTWNKAGYPNVVQIDLSTSPDFAAYASKNVAGATSTVYGDYLATDMTNFRTQTDGKNALWSFWPDQTYYFRLWYDNKHSQVISYFVPKCAGTGGVSYKQCNETCSANKECGPNLACVSGQCRRADNTGSDLCVAQPDKGLSRTCNEYCSDSKECGGGLTCHWNRCRAPKNLESTSCATTAARGGITKGGAYGTNYVTSTAGTDYAAPEAQCSEACKGNRDCAVNLRCYQGSCRLPANPTDAACLTAEASSNSTTSAVATPVVIATAAPVEPEPEAPQASLLAQIGQWLATRLGFLIVGLVIAIILIVIWPLLRGPQRPLPPQRPPSPPTPPRPMTQPTATSLSTSSMRPPQPSAPSPQSSAFNNVMTPPKPPTPPQPPLAS